MRWRMTFSFYHEGEAAVAGCPTGTADPEGCFKE